MRSAPAVAVLTGCLLLLGGCGGQGDDPLYVFAAASLEEALTEIAAEFELREGRPVALNFGGSNALAQQIRNGAPADVFVSADVYWAEDLARDHLLVASSYSEVLANRLVVVGHESSTWEMSDLGDLPALGFSHLSLGDPEAVPAGRYAKILLEGVRLANGSDAWSAVRASVVPAPDVRAALALVREEPRAIGIVYATDYATTEGVRLLFEVSDSMAPPIRYVAAAVAASTHPVAAARFLAYGRSEAAAAVYRRYGFVPLEGGG
ncbi:MAG: molybdate ABC transporter substrate-binding protein [Acidobacteriota bacterium]|nr:molybdate ABC transporter substrate-binding protein [Acidobacteriota bacterium]